MNELIEALGDPVEDAEEEAFLLFSQQIPSHNLGFVDPKAHHIDLTLLGKQVRIRQSPGLLQSNRSEGTTGAVLWAVTPLFAEWIASPQNVLARCGVLARSACVALELGCGVSGLVGLALAKGLLRYVCTDLEYTLKLVRENVASNLDTFVKTSGAAAGSKHNKSKAKKSEREDKSKDANADADMIGNIQITPLDWETTSLPTLYKDLSLPHLDLLISCDCIYNESLIDPLATTMRDICRLAPDERPTVCVVAQQLRSPDVMEAWLVRFMREFCVWRVNGGEMLGEGSGFVVHVGLLREVVGRE